MYRILVAKSNPDVLFTVSEILGTSLDCEILSAHDGPEALHKIQKEHPDLVILDTHMPFIDGFEVCRMVKNGADTKYIPVIFLTAACADLDSKIRGLELGADDYLIEPVDHRELAARVKAMLRIKCNYDELFKTGLELQAAERNKFVFLPEISHELRSPLNSILGFVELIMNEHYGPINDSQRRYLSIVDRSGRRLLGLADDISLLAKLETNNIHLDMETFSLARLIEQVWLNFRDAANAKNISFECQASSDLDHITGDKRALQIVLENILDNAVKFNRFGGSVKLRFYLQESSARGAEKVIITVSDSGRGIASEDKPKIFLPFPKIRKQDGEHGSGLGLVICKKMLQLVSGSMVFESEVGAGTTFTITIPYSLECQSGQK